MDPARKRKWEDAGSSAPSAPLVVPSDVAAPPARSTSGAFASGGGAASTADLVLERIRAVSAVMRAGGGGAAKLKLGPLLLLLQHRLSPALTSPAHPQLQTRTAPEPSRIRRVRRRRRGPPPRHHLCPRAPADPLRALPLRLRGPRRRPDRPPGPPIGRLQGGLHQRRPRARARAPGQAHDAGRHPAAHPHRHVHQGALLPGRAGRGGRGAAAVPVHPARRFGRTGALDGWRMEGPVERMGVGYGCTRVI